MISKCVDVPIYVACVGCGIDFLSSRKLYCSKRCYQRRWERSRLRHVKSEYDIWRGMIRRCTDPRRPDFVRYGGRGIRVCERWRESFQAFLLDMGTRPSQRHSIDRIDSNGHYEPSNCRWATVEEQHRNRRDNFYVEHEGQRLTLSELARRFGLDAATLRGRLMRGWPIASALGTPARRRSVKRAAAADVVPAAA